jgi:putative phosphoesterase
MTRIGLISDTHGFLDPQLRSVFTNCDQIWHAGDFGDISVFDELTRWNIPLKCVYGNIDGHQTRVCMPEQLIWEVEDRKIWMIHIGGYPGHYPTKIKQSLKEIRPDVFVCGHSHILKIMYDQTLGFLHLNPGSCGREGFHKVRSAITFSIEGTAIQDMAVIELGPRGNL